MANEPKLAWMNFINALEKIPKITESHGRELEQIKQKIPVYEAVAATSWKKEDELKELKRQVIELDRKIALSLKREDNSEVKKEEVVSDNRKNIPEEKLMGVKVRM